MLQREDIVLVTGTAGGIALILTGHTDLGMLLIGAGGLGKGLIPAITPGVTVQTLPNPNPVVVVNGKNYIQQPDGSLKPQ